MKLYVTGNVNEYYVQTLCMIFFPGEKFSGEEEPGAPVMWMDVTEDETQVTASARLTYRGKETRAEKVYLFDEENTADRTRKIAVGHAVLSSAGEMMHYRPSWGMLTGVRPSKVATEMLLKGMSKTQVRKKLASQYQVLTKKAALATDVAIREREIIGTPDKKDCSVYISIPFCPTRCTYCSFVSYTSKRLLSLIPDYLALLCKEVRQKFATIKELGLRVLTVYIGGGTPTILTEEQLETLLSTVAECTDVTALREYTLESGRPDTITKGKMELAKKYGVTRVCVNPQTLCDEVLKGVGRCHSAEDFRKSYHIAREAGIDCINTDLIVGLPGDTYENFCKSYDEILQMAPENITVHTFCVKKSAEILREGKRVYNLRGGDAGKCVDYSQISSAAQGYAPYYMYRQKNMVGNYENVGFAKEGKECLYNIYMMEEVHSIFAAGAGAVTKLVDYAAPGSGEKSFIKRLFNPKYPYEYLESDGGASQAEEIAQFYGERDL